MSSKIVLIDIPSREPCAAWSPNSWRTRLALNYKGIDYETRWVEYPDLAPLLKSFGLAPNAKGMAYTIPTIKTEEGSYIMDSKKIAKYLETEYGAPKFPSLHLDDPVLARVEDLMPGLFRLGPVILPKTSRNVLNPSSAEYFERTRKEILGMSLAELEQSKSEQAWKDLEGGLAEMAALLKETEGPYFMGNVTSYADFYLVTYLHWCKCVDATSIFDRVITFDSAFREIYDAYSGYLSKDI